MAGLLTLASCSDFLNETSQDEVLVKDANDYSELLMGSGYPSPTVLLGVPLVCRLAVSFNGTPGALLSSLYGLPKMLTSI